MPTVITGESGINKIQDNTVTSSKIVNGGIGYSDLPIGSVVQVVSTQSNTHPLATTTSLTLVSSGFSLSITPKYSTSKLLIIGGFNTHWTGTSSGNGSGYALYRDGVNLSPGGGASGNTAFVYHNSVADYYTKASYSYYLNANSTAATTFTLYFRAWTAGTAGINVHDGTCEMTILEVLA